jgi:hypothetical protein
MSFVNELFERLSKSTSASDVQSALASLDNIHDLIERSKAARETLELMHTYGQELIDKGQYKNAAYQYYSGSQVVKKFLNDPNLENQWLLSSAQALANASQEHITWDDLLGGAACMTISSLLRIITGDWNVNNHLDDFIKANDFSANQAATACLYIPYNLASAISTANPNPGLLQQASDFTEQYLMTSKPASMFVDGIKRAIDKTRQILVDTTKFPSIKAKFNFGTDIIFGENFNFIVNIENIGEGNASDVTASIDIPSSVTVVSGESQISLQELSPHTPSEASFTLICPSGEGNEEIMVEIPISVEYTDILGNKNSLSVGMAVIPIRSEKKGDKLITQLNDLKKALQEITGPIESSSNEEVQSIVKGMTSIISDITTKTGDQIQKGEFESAEAGLDQLTQIQEFFNPLTNFLILYQDQLSSIALNLKEIKNQSQGLINSIEKIENKFKSD